VSVQYVSPRKSILRNLPGAFGSETCHGSMIQRFRAPFAEHKSPDGSAWIVQVQLPNGTLGTKLQCLYSVTSTGP
jgi:hypothetical protein